MVHLIKSLLLITCIFMFSSAQIQTVIIDSQSDGKVDWGNRTIIARGIGAPNPDLPDAARRAGAIRAAQMVALRTALETIKGMFLNSSTTVQNFITTHDEVSTRINGYLRGFEQKGEEKTMQDGSVEIIMEIPIDGVGGIGEALLTASLNTEKSPPMEFNEKKRKKDILFTGLIIDCRGLKVKPALSPKVYDESGREVYGSAYIEKEWAVKYGMVAYTKSVEQAAHLNRIGDKPGKIKALRVTGSNNTDIIIAKNDAADIRSTSENLKFLSQCRVVFIID